MTVKERNGWWYVRNSAWVLIALVPWLYWLPFFYVGKQLKDKFYRTVGYVQLGIFICLAIGIVTQLGPTCLMLLMLQWCICFIWCVVLLKEYLIRLKEREKRQQLEQSLVRNKLAQPVPAQPAEVPRQVTAPAEEPQQEVQLLNVNSCTEEELCSLPGISIIEAKKMTDLRQTHGDFATVEQFVAAIGIKPHVAARIADRLYAEPTAARASAAKAASRILDI